MWLSERQLEELEVDKDTRGKRTSELNSTIIRLEMEVQTHLVLSLGKLSRLRSIHTNIQTEAEEGALFLHDQLMQRLCQLAVNQSSIETHLYDMKEALQQKSHGTNYELQELGWQRRT